MRTNGPLHAKGSSHMMLIREDQNKELNDAAQ